MTDQALDARLQEVAAAVRRTAGSPLPLTAIRLMAARRRAARRARMLAAVVAGGAMLPPVVAASLVGVAPPSPLGVGAVAIALSLGVVPAMTAARVLARARPEHLRQRHAP